METIEDAKAAVRSAFENMIIEKIKNLKGTNDLTNYSKSSDRFVNLVDNNMLPFAKRLKDKDKSYTENIAIGSGILSEIYKYGVSKEQLSNLKALADYMGGKHHKSDGKNVIEISINGLCTYFEEE